MQKIKGQAIVDLVNKINQENEPDLEKYIAKFFDEYIDISFFDKLTFTGEEHIKVENAITHLVRLCTLTSVTTTLKVLKDIGVVELTED
ncbi:hypothetical protein NCCP2222_19260 [Sporosarcina sp. NCCP-2222]|uniref:hypothetical protein n=1 Tax=Sporosarcina sp. NCCP-2222 TaxID=2935073 RepID=UPI00208183B0|nr:hypothetical protein [Sporosarcina sp. NCCP-2222]GKV55979.1 hypothetical protein NCCP2222_19260 [Sporosarcina sp. NCCP-2222]